MHGDPLNLLAILVMALGAYGCRAGGYWLFNRVNPSPAVRALLAYVPGCLFVSYVTPAVINGGPKAWVGAAVAAVTMKLTGSLVWPIFTGTAAAWLTWLLMS
jgi:uncharacterized membrane protein